MDWLELIESTIPKNKKKVENKYLYKHQKIDDNIDYDSIIKNDMSKNSDIEILNQVSLVSKYVKSKMIDEKKDNIFEYKDHILWIKDCIKVLAEKNNQDITKKKLNTNNNTKLQRNSYKFCEYGYECKYAYNLKQKCFSQHFVYDLVYQDIDRLLIYMENNDIDLNAIRTSINTITFVITHMNEEILLIKNKKQYHYQLYLTRKLKFQK